jgi:hypothetical protein
VDPRAVLDAAVKRKIPALSGNRTLELRSSSPFLLNKSRVMNLLGILVGEQLQNLSWPGRGNEVKARTHN